MLDGVRVERFAPVIEPPGQLRAARACDVRADLLGECESISGGQPGVAGRVDGSGKVARVGGRQEQLHRHAEDREHERDGCKDGQYPPGRASHATNATWLPPASVAR